MPWDRTSQESLVQLWQQVFSCQYWGDKVFTTNNDFRDTHAVISLEAYRHNLRYFKNKVSPTKIMPVIKADGYGHGAVELAKIAEAEDVDYLVVAFLSEGIELRENGIKSPILVLNYFKPEFLHLLTEFDLTATIYSLAQYNQLKSYLQEKPLKAHVIIDTGMSRVGFNHVDAVESVQELL